MNTTRLIKENEGMVKDKLILPKTKATTNKKNNNDEIINNHHHKIKKEEQEKSQIEQAGGSCLLKIKTNKSED